MHLRIDEDKHGVRDDPHDRAGAEPSAGADFLPDHLRRADRAVVLQRAAGVGGRARLPATRADLYGPRTHRGGLPRLLRRQGRVQTGPRLLHRLLHLPPPQLPHLHRPPQLRLTGAPECVLGKVQRGHAILS